MELLARLALKDVVDAVNVADLLHEDDLRAIGLNCLTELRYDESARADWDKTYAEAMKLALQVTEEKSFPWPNCSNVKFPLLTVAAMHFHARAYPNLIPSGGVVIYRPYQEDPTGEYTLRARRVSAHMNYQLLQATDWEEGVDKALIIVPIMGCAFKKSFYSHNEQTNVSKLVLPQHLIVPYFTTSLETTPRISEVFTLTSNELKTKVRRGLYKNWEYIANYSLPETTQMEQAKNQAQHLTPVAFPDEVPPAFIEQHCFIDLDGDGYKEPYIVTFIKETGQVCRIIARFTLEDVFKGEGTYSDSIAYIQPQHYYTKIPFIPSPDGGFYDAGLGSLLGPTNHAVNSLINQMLDAGTMQLLGGGFLGRSVKIRKGDNTFKPYEWKSVESPGSSLKENIVPLPRTEPSTVLLELMMFLVGWGERIGGANDVQQGELPGQNIKAEAMQIANANGSRVFAAIYKRIRRAFKEEFVKLHNLNGRYYGAQQAVVLRQGPKVELADYRMPMDGIEPIADPNIASKEDLQKQSQMVLTTCLNIPGQDVREATMRMYRAFDVPEPDKLWPTGVNAIPQQPNPKVMEAEVRRLVAETHRLQVTNAHQMAVGELMRKARETEAKIVQLEADARLKSAQAAGEGAGNAIALINAEIAAKKNDMDNLLSFVEVIQGAMANAEQSDRAARESLNPGGTGVAKLAAPPTDATVLSLSERSPGAGEGGMGAA